MCGHVWAYNFSHSERPGSLCWNAGLWRRHDHDRSAWAISAWVIPAYFVGRRRFPLLFLYHHHRELNSQTIKPTVARLSYILHDSSISRDPHLLTPFDENMYMYLDIPSTFEKSTNRYLLCVCEEKDLPPDPAGIQGPPAYLCIFFLLQIPTALIK